jgi:signal transduction histidine kinase
MNISFNGIQNMMPDHHYPFRPVEQMIRTLNENTPMSILEKKMNSDNGVLDANSEYEDAHPELDKRPGIFATALAHEVRNPLTNINLAAEILGTSKLDADQQAFVEIISRAALRINKIVADFLNSHKAIEAHAELCYVNELLDEVLEVNNDRVRLKTVLVIKNFSNDPIQILVNRSEIKIALINVIVNAIEALPPGKGVLKLSTGSLKDKCSISIEDNGIGISEMNLKKIFDPYFTNKPGGMGLGLSTTNDILASNCGSLDVKSKMGAGSTFTFSFNRVSPV